MHLKLPILVLISACLAAAPATNPSLESRADAAFGRGEYASAMVLFQKLKVELKDQPDKVTSVDERIRVCQTQLQNAGALAAPTTAPTAAERTPHAPPKPGETREMAIKELGNFDYDA